MKAIIYARVSTAKCVCACGRTFLSSDGQPVCPACGSLTIERSQNPENQLLELRDYARRQGFEVLHEFTDRATASKEDREQFQLMWNWIRTRRQPVTLLFWSLDRLSREGALKTLKYLEDLTVYRVTWVSLTEPYLSSAGPLKEAIIALMATLAKMERGRIVERTKAGLERARQTGTRSGKAIGRPAGVTTEGKAIDGGEIDRVYGETGSVRGTARRLGLAQSTVRLRVKGRAPKRVVEAAPRWSEPVWGTWEHGLFVERAEGKVVVRYDLNTGVPWCINHQMKVQECAIQHGQQQGGNDGNDGDSVRG